MPSYNFNALSGNFDMMLSYSEIESLGFVPYTSATDNVNLGSYGITSTNDIFEVTDGGDGYIAKFISVPTSGSGTRMFFDMGKAAFRAGSVFHTQWDDFNIGLGSVALGKDNLASGTYSAAIGFGGSAIGSNSVVIGQSIAYSTSGIGIGTQCTVSASQAIAIGTNAEASGVQSMATGYNTVADGPQSFATGYQCEVYGTAGFAGGYNSTSNGSMSFVYGQGCETLSHYSSAMGNYALARQEGHQTFCPGRFPSNLGTAGNAQTVNAVIRKDFEPYAEGVINDPASYIIVQDFTVGFNVSIVFRADDGTAAFVTKKILVTDVAGTPNLIASTGETIDPSSLIDTLDIYMDANELTFEFVSNYNDDMGVVIKIEAIENGYKKVIT